MIYRKHCRRCDFIYWTDKPNRASCPQCAMHKKFRGPVPGPPVIPPISTIDFTDSRREPYQDMVRQSDWQEEQAGRGQFRSAYRALLGGDAPKCRPGDTVTAAAFLAKIELAIEQSQRSHADGGYVWTRTERNRLYRMRNKWKVRASGRDARFNLFGNVSGRLDQYDERRLSDERRRIRLLD